METLFTVLGVVGVFVVLLALVNFKAVKRMFSALTAQVGKLGRAAVKVDPLAQYEQAIDNAQSDVVNATRGLEHAGALVNQVARQVETDRAEQAELIRRIQLALEHNDPNNTAEDNAVRLAEVERRLEENRAQLKNEQEQYNRFLQQLQTAKERIRVAEEDARRLGARRRQAKARAELSEIAGNFSGLDDSELARARQLVEEETDGYNAKAQVSSDLNVDFEREQADRDLEKKARAASILERFKKPVESDAPQSETTQS